jgi:hypothetical protein
MNIVKVSNQAELEAAIKDTPDRIDITGKWDDAFVESKGILP